jgi:hypothetical protein
MIRHMVLLRFRDDTTDTRKAEIYATLAALSGHIEGILDFQTRTNVSPETPVVHGFRDLFWFDFRDAGVRDAYLADAAHKAAGTRLVAALEGGRDGLVVCDFEL